MEDLIFIVVIVIIVLLVCFYLFRTTRRLRRLKSDLDRDGSDIELLFKKRHDELPRLIQTCRSYMPAERDLLASVSAARKDAQGAETTEEKARARTTLSESLKDLFSRSSAYPDLQNNNIFAQLHARIFEIEERITERVDLYNDDVTLFNRRISRFPSSMAARLAQLKPLPPYCAKPPMGSRHREFGRQT